MKKTFMIALVAAAALSFSACNTKTDGAGGTDGKDSTKVETTTTTTTTTETTASSNVIDKYAELVEKSIALQEKAQKGDAAAIEELTKIGQELTTISAELQKELATMTPEQVAKFNEIAQKLAGQAAAQ